MKLSRSRFLRLGLSAVGLAPLALAGCRSREGRGSAPRGVKLGLLLADADSPLDRTIRRSVEAFAQEKGFELLVENGAGQPSGQASGLQSLLQRQVSVVIVRPVDPKKFAPLAQKARESEVYFVALEQNLPEADVSTVVEFNQELAGQLAADYLRHRFPSGGKVALLLDTKQPGAARQREAFQEYLREHAPALRLAGLRMGAEPGFQRTLAEELLEADPDLRAIYATSDSAALAAVEAIRRRKSSGLVVGYGGLPETVELVKRGNSPLAMLLGILPQRMGRVAARQAWNVVSNRPARERVSIPVLPVTADNYGSYPSWEEEPPRDLAIPWPSSLTLEMKRE